MDMISKFKKQFSILAVLFFLSSIQAQEISPYLMGQNYWLENGDEGRVGHIHKLWDKVEASGVKTIRIGGNGYQNNFPDRARLNNMIDSIKAIGAEPILQVSSTFTDLQAKELVEYYSKDNSRKVTFWSIGNEPLLHERHTVEQVHKFVVRIARAMKSVNPHIKIFIFDEASLREEAYDAFVGGEKDITGLKENGAWLIDGINFHNYPMGAEFERDDVVFFGPNKILKQIEHLKELMQTANKKHNRNNEDALIWGLTEFNVTYANPDREISGFGNPSFLGGQFMAEIFGFGMKYGAFMMNPWCISEVDVVRTDFGYIGMPVEFYPRSTYYHMQLLSEYSKKNFLTSVVNQEYVKIIATSDDSGVMILVMNQHPKKDFDFNIVNRNTSFETELNIELGTTIPVNYKSSIPNQTTKLFIFSNNGSLEKEVVYSLEHNLSYAPPTIVE
tara:strand:+ start:22260 stop:23594 length:1335 start_codon:yes stop_codon:yes gene_type:complete